MTRSTPFFPLTGGMDLVTPAVALPPGRVIAALNYEPTASGYRRLRGFERFDGRPAPSEGNYWVLHFTAGDADGLNVAVGDNITTAGGSTLWTASVAIAPVVTSGSFAGGNAVGYVVVVNVSAAGGPPGPATPGDLIKEGVTAWATITSTVENDPVAAATSAAGIAAIATALRSHITAVPGSGPVRGIFFERGRVIAVRDNAGATEGVMHRSTELGWDAVDLAVTFAFNSGGVRELVPFDFITGATSSAEGMIKSVTLTSGTWAGGDAAGSAVVAVLSGTFQAENVDVTFNPVQAAAGTSTVQVNIATLTNTGTMYALPAGGSYEFIHHNFFGAADLAATYGVNGVGQAIVYDAFNIGGPFPLLTIQTLAPIPTGMVADTPNHLAQHRGSLFLSFPGGSIQYSVVGEPTIFDPVLGTGEIGVGSDVTALIPANQGTLAILAEDSISVLYGSDSSDYQLEVLTSLAGAKPNSAVKFGQVFYMDNRGIRSLSATQAYGNFSIGTLSQLIEPLLKDYAKDDVEPVGRLVSRSAGQIWYFFSNGAGIVIYLGKKQPEILPFNLGKTVSCAVSVEDDGEERLFIGCSDGFVYELNKGTSFDGSAIEHYVALPYHHFGAPEQNKRIHKAVVNIEAAGATTIQIAARLDYGAVDGIAAQTISITSGGGAIDDLGSNESYYASQIEARGEVHLGAFAKTVSLKIGGSTSTEEPHTLTGVTFHVSPRGLQR